MDQTKSLESSELKVLIAKYSPYLSEIRKRILITVLVFLLTSVVGFVFYESIIKFLINSLSLGGVNIVFTSPFQFINLAISCGIATGLLFTFPLIIFQSLSFLKPALKIKEYRMVIGLIPFSIFLFVIGFIFGAFIMRWQIAIFLDKSLSLGIGNVLDISHLLSVVILTSTLLGIGFQFPIVLLLLMRLGMVKSHQISTKRRWIYLGALIFAILLPADSILADILLALPLIILFEFILFLNWLLRRKN